MREARGAIFGLTRNPAPAEIARAALEAVGYQTRDLLEAMRADWPDGAAGTVLRVDGGMTASDWTHAVPGRHSRRAGRPAGGDGDDGAGRGLSRRASRPASARTSMASPRTWRLDRRFEPAMDEATRARKWAGWQAAIARVRAAG